MKLLVAVACAVAVATPALGYNLFSGRKQLGETWVYPIMFQQALAPLAPMARDALKAGRCPGMQVAPGGVVHSYDFDARLKRRGTGEFERWEVTELKLLNPSACPALDEDVTALLRTTVPQFAEPWKDKDGNGLTRLPRIQIRLTD
jgi:hypothetical protein